MHPFLTLPSAHPGAFRATQEGFMEKRDAWEKVTPPWKKVPTASIFSFSPIPPRGLMQQGDGQAGREQQMAGETNYDAGGGQPLLRKKYHVVRKKYHVVRKKNHVVRKKVYVASVFAAPQAPPCGCCWPMMDGRCKPHGRRGPQHSCCGREISSVYPLHRL